LGWDWGWMMKLAGVQRTQVAPGEEEYNSAILESVSPTVARCMIFKVRNRERTIEGEE
jgi:hypothetical protein